MVESCAIGIKRTDIGLSILTVVMKNMAMYKLSDIYIYF